MTIVATSTIPIVSGVATPTANGLLTAFTFPHGLGRVPTHVNVTPGNVLSATLLWATWDATNVTVNYATAPLTGALSLYFLAV